MFSDKNTDAEIQSPSPQMRKSVENLVLTSHDVIGQSINQALAFSGAMTSSAIPQPPSPRGDKRTPSPSLSPHNSPNARNRREQSRSETHLFVPTKDHFGSQLHNQTNHSDKTDTADPDNISRSSDSSQLADQHRSVSNESERGDKDRESRNRTSKRESRGNDRSKKKSSWYNALYPTYKSRSEDFKRIFKDVPDDERLVVDYSCALQKDILVQGRLYVSQNFLCFYANIFRWETSLALKWTEVTAITKEKTALVIPNAILVCTDTEKHFFTTFTARDKAYLMLFRVWQHALMDQPMSMQLMWQWVHTCYGDELGLSSDDEAFASHTNEDDKLSSARISVDSLSEECLSIGGESSMANGNQVEDIESVPHPRSHSPTIQLPTDMSDTTESDVDKNPLFSPKPIICPASHAGRQLVQIELPIHVDALFTLLFTGSRFLADFHAQRNTQDYVHGAWTNDPVKGVKNRIVTLTVALTQSVGPKSSQVTESQVMLPCSKPGQLYAIDIDSSNAGIPYAESFYVILHYCLVKTGENLCSFSAHAQIKYKKSVWGVVKGFIEKNCWAGLEDFFDALLKALAIECELSAGRPRKPRHRRRVIAPPIRPVDDVCRPRKTVLMSYAARVTTAPVTPPQRYSNDSLVWVVLLILTVLVFLNAALYYKLWALEEQAALSYAEIHVIKNPPQSHDEWLRILQRQESIHSAEMRKWQRVLQSAIHLLRKTEQSLGELQLALQPSYGKSEIEEITQNQNNLNSDL